MHKAHGTPHSGNTTRQAHRTLRPSAAGWTTSCPTCPVRQPTTPPASKDPCDRPARRQNDLRLRRPRVARGAGAPAPPVPRVPWRVARGRRHERGYRTLKAKSGKNSPTNFGWGKSARILDQINGRTGNAVMLIPLFHAHDSTPSTYQLHADNPRMSPPTPGRRPRVMKFEMPPGIKRGTAHGDLPADVNPLRHHEAQSDWPLILAEGVPKAEAGAILTAAIREGIDLVPVALTGVTMGYEAEHTGLDQAAVERKLANMVTALASGRERVYLCWDSDWADKRQVRDSLVRTGACSPRPASKRSSASPCPIPKATTLTPEPASTTGWPAATCSPTCSRTTRWTRPTSTPASSGPSPWPETSSTSTKPGSSCGTTPSSASATRRSRSPWPP